MSNLIRSANGSMIDMEQIRLKNEKEIALGNMGVNARGDVIDQKKEPVITKAQRMKEHYQLHSAMPASGTYKKSSTEVTPAPRERVVEEETTAETEKAARPVRGSLAASLADIPAAPAPTPKE